MSAVIYVIIVLVILNYALPHKVECVSVLAARSRDKNRSSDGRVI